MEGPGPESVAQFHPPCQVCGSWRRARHHAGLQGGTGVSPVVPTHAACMKDLPVPEGSGKQKAKDVGNQAGEDRDAICGEKACWPSHPVPDSVHHQGVPFHVPCRPPAFHPLTEACIWPGSAPVTRGKALAKADCTPVLCWCVCHAVGRDAQVRSKEQRGSSARRNTGTQLPAGALLPHPRSHTAVKTELAPFTCTGRPRALFLLLVSR